MPHPTLPSAVRMHRPAEFAAVLKSRRRIRGTFFIITSATSRLSTEPGKDYTRDYARLGMVIGKRHAPRAVTRNTLKRIIREVFRTARHLLPPADYVVRLYVRVPAMSLSALKLAVRAELDSHFARLVR